MDKIKIFCNETAIGLEEAYNEWALDERIHVKSRQFAFSTNPNVENNGFVELHDESLNFALMVVYEQASE